MARLQKQILIETAQFLGSRISLAMVLIYFSREKRTVFVLTSKTATRADVKSILRFRMTESDENSFCLLLLCLLHAYEVVQGRQRKTICPEA